MTFLTGVEIRRRIASGEIEIYSTVEEEEFNPDSQVTEDSIDLRLSPLMLRCSTKLPSLDYLDPKLESYYEEFRITETGYDLKPLETVASQTLEMVCLPDNLVGLVVTRSTFARLGIMVNLCAPKFAAGIHWCFPLQLFNASQKTIRIYPFAPVAQLLVSEMSGEAVGYRGRYQDSSRPLPPMISDRERLTLTARNPDAAFRTKHVVGRAAQGFATESRASLPLRSDKMDPEPAKDETSTPGPVGQSNEELAEALARLKTNLRWSAFSLIQVVILAATLFVSFDVFRRGSASFWVVVAVALVGLVAFFAEGMLLIRALQLHQERPARLWRSVLTTFWGWLGAALVALAISLAVSPPPD